jgi:hypothetical protein
MAIVVYKCTVCNREVEIERNKQGLEVIQKCIITKRCRGELYQTRILTDYVRGKLPDTVTGLDNWEQRKVLFNYYQTVDSATWKIVHNLNSIPTIQTYIKSVALNGQETLTLTEPSKINVIDQNTVELVFERPYAGMSQLVSHTSNSNILASTSTVDTSPVQITTNQEFSFGLRGSSTTNIVLEVEVISTDGTSTLITYTVDNIPSVNSPWHAAKRISINGLSYSVRSFNINTGGLLNAVSNGAIIKIIGIDITGGLNFVPLQKLQAVILLSKAPYKIFDTITDQYVDMVATVDNSAMFYENDEFKVIRDVVKSTFPPIYTFTN